MYADILAQFPVKATESVCLTCAGRGVVVCDNCARLPIPDLRPDPHRSWCSRRAPLAQAKALDSSLASSSDTAQTTSWISRVLLHTTPREPRGVLMSYTCHVRGAVEHCSAVLSEGDVCTCPVRWRGEMPLPCAEGENISVKAPARAPPAACTWAAGRRLGACRKRAHPCCTRS